MGARPWRGEAERPSSRRRAASSAELRSAVRGQAPERPPRRAKGGPFSDCRGGPFFSCHQHARAFEFFPGRARASADEVVDMATQPRPRRFARPRSLLLPLLLGYLSWSSSSLAQDLDRSTAGAPVDWVRVQNLAEDEDGELRALGTRLEAHFTRGGARLVPVLGSRAPATQVLTIAALEVTRGNESVALQPGQAFARDASAIYPRAPGVEERFTLVEGGLEHSMWIAEPLGSAGDLVVRFELGGNLSPHGQRLADGSHRFDDGLGGLVYGGLTAIDAGGASTAGEVRLIAGELHWRIPASFVDVATWPLLLDPLIGDLQAFETPAVGYSDAAFDDSTQTYLVVWERELSSTERVLRGQRFSAAGLPIGGTLAISEVTTSRGPKVANVNGVNRFAVAWVWTFFGESQVRLRIVDAATGAIGSTAFVQGEPEGSITSLDVAGEHLPGQTNQVWLVWDSNANGLVGARYSVPSSGNGAVLQTFPAAPSPGLFSRLKAPSVVTRPSNGGRLGVAWVQTGAFGANDRVFAASFARSGALVHAPIQISPSSQMAGEPSLDGGGAFGAERFVVAWTQTHNANAFTARVRTWRPGGSSLLSDSIALGTGVLPPHATHGVEREQVLRRGPRKCSFRRAPLPDHKFERACARPELPRLHRL